MYTINPDQSLVTWALGHGWCSQRCNAATPVEIEADPAINGPVETMIATSPCPPVMRTPSPSETQIDGPGKSVLVVYESHHDRASGVVDAITDAAASRGYSTLVRATGDVTSADVSASDAVIAGCWMPGKAPLSSQSTRRMMGWIEALTPMEGKPVGLFCTYRFFPFTFADTASRTARMERELTTRFEGKGAKVVARKSIYFKSIDEEAAELVQSVLTHVPTTREPTTVPDDGRQTA